MKAILPLRFYPVILGALFLGLAGCSKPLTKQKVTEDIEDAREATADAKEAVLEALQARQQLYVDYRETKIAEFEKRLDDIDDNIDDLNKTSRTSENKGAEANIESAIDNLENEKKALRRQIDEVRSIEKQDWSRSFEQVNNAIRELEEVVQRLTESLAEYK